MALQARTEFAAAINQIASEKGVDTAVIIDAIEQAALAAYRKDLSYRNEAIPDDFEELTAKIDPASGEIGIYRGDENITPPGFARIAAQTAKQVIAQKLHEAEKGAIFEEYQEKVGTVVSGAIQRQEGNTYFIDIGRAEGVLPPSEQIRGELYSLTSRMKFYIKEIREGGRGPEVVVSRADPHLVKGLFAMEVPEIQSNAVEIKEIAREAGARTKVAVVSHQEGVDPVGSLVGQKGVRVQAVITELGEEKIDIILYSDETDRFIAAALSPAKDIIVHLDENNKIAKVKIPDNQLSLAIGKGGQNVRLAAKLTGWKIDIEGTDTPEERAATAEAKALASASAEATEDEEGTKEHEQQLGANKQNSTSKGDQGDTDEDAVAAVENIEANIDEATVEASVDGVTEVEPSDEEAGKVAADADADAEADIEATEGEKGSMEETPEADRGDLLASGEQSEIGVSESTVSDEKANEKESKAQTKKGKAKKSKKE